MDKTIGYILSSLQVTDAAVTSVFKRLVKQNRVNKLFALLAIAGGVYIYRNESQKEKTKVKIDTLTRKVEELNNLKGE